jgi:hypothetical protein
MDWQPISTAPKGEIVVVNDERYAWGTAQWARERVGRSKESREGWWDNGFWLDPQPTLWFPVPPTPQMRGAMNQLAKSFVANSLGSTYMNTMASKP